MHSIQWYAIIFLKVSDSNDECTFFNDMLCICYDPKRLTEYVYPMKIFDDFTIDLNW